jgi:hypothetical protein
MLAAASTPDPFGSFPGEALVTIDAAPERVICARLMW